MKLEDYLRFFEVNHVSIQLTLGIGVQPTVHALYPNALGERNQVHMTEGVTLEDALEKMRVKYVNRGEL